MKEMSCEVPYSEELWAKLSEQMDEFGQIRLGEEEAVIEVMPVTQKNFINEVMPVLEFFVEFGSQIVIGVVVNWICENMKGQKITIAGHTIQVGAKEEVVKVIEEVSHVQK